MKKRRRRRREISITTISCDDCRMHLQIRPAGLGAICGGGWQGDWYMVKDHIWRLGQRAGECRFLCVKCLEGRIDRKLTADDFRRSAKVNFHPQQSNLLRRRMRGLKPAKRLIETTFNIR